MFYKGLMMFTEKQKSKLREQNFYQKSNFYSGLKNYNLADLFLAK